MTVVGGTGMEWVCVRPVHAKVYQRRSSDRTHKKGDPVYSDNKAANAHHFRRKYPNRDVQEEADA